MNLMDDLCVFSGLRPDRSPVYLFRTLKPCLKMIVDDIQSQNLDLDLDRRQLRKEIKKVLRMCTRSEGEYFWEGSAEGILEWEHFNADMYWKGQEALVIGTFDQEGHGLFVNGEGNVRKPPSGSEVSIRLVDLYLKSGTWGKVLNERGYFLSEDFTSVFPDETNSNILCLRTPFQYLRKWVNRRTLPPRRIAFPSQPKMDFIGEFYEIVHTRLRSRRLNGTLPCIDYEGIELVWNGVHDFFEDGFESATHLGAALKAGLRGDALVSPLLNDFRTWQAYPPDQWALLLDVTDFATVELPASDASSGLWDRLPPEIIDQIFKILPFKDMFAFTSTCRLAYHREKPAIISTLRYHILNPWGALHWLLPVDTVRDDVTNFLQACLRPGMFKRGPETAQLLKSTILDPEFPLVAFVRRNYRTDSMRNRQRLWRIAKQFRNEWYKYRTKGYEYNIFEQGFRQLDTEDYSSEDET